MDGSDGTNTPSAGLSSPQSTQASPNPDSSGVLPDHPGSPKSVGNLTPNSTAASSAMTVAPRPNSPLPLTGGHKHFGNPLAAGLLVPRHGSEALHVASMALNAVSRAGMNPSLSPLGYGTNGPRMHPASPPGMSGDGAGNECRLIDYRGAKVAAFLVNGEYLLCLPQAFELFLKHLVGGLHTVYTKLKRLDITPIVCNVEQVRILRGLGAIQPGVNRCKLLSCKDFDMLYKDCTTARLHGNASSLRHQMAGLCDHPGRPPKRASLVGLGSPTVNHHAHSALLKKSRLDGEYGSYENGHITGDRLDKSHLLPNGYGHHAAVSQAAATSPHINPLPFMALNHPGATHPGALLPTLPMSSRPQNLSSSTRTDGSVIKDRSSHGSEVINSSSSREEIVDSKDRLYGFDSHRLKDPTFLNGYFWLLAGASANGHSPVLNLSQNSSRNVVNSGGGDQSGSEAAYNECADDEYNDTEDDEDDDRDQDLSDNPDVSSTANTDRVPANQGLPFPATAGDLNAAVALQGVSSIETLLRNIQGLLKVAADNARHQERQINLEKAELKMEILREREIRENMEKQLLDEQRIRILYQKRLKREKKCRRRLQDQLETEVKKRNQYDEALRNSSGETLRLLNETFAQELERERNSRSEPERKIQDCPMSA